MKKSTIGTILGVVAIIGFIIAASVVVIDGNNRIINYNKYDLNNIVATTFDNGNIGEHVKGNEDAAAVIIEYADFQCPGCAGMNININKAVEKSNGKLAVAYRSFIMAYHQNGNAAASAAEAAGLQGYWKEYGDKLFSEQAEWGYAEEPELTEYFEKYFNEVTDNKGDIDRFRKDITSDNVKKKIEFDMGAAKRVQVASTPSLYIDGQLIEWSFKDESTASASISVNGEVITWDHSLTNQELIDLLLDIADKKSK